jgi:hypothetical protein
MDEEGSGLAPVLTCISDFPLNPYNNAEKYYLNP